MVSRESGELGAFVLLNLCYAGGDSLYSWLKRRSFRRRAHVVLAMTLQGALECLRLPPRSPPKGKKEKRSRSAKDLPQHHLCPPCRVQKIFCMVSFLIPSIAL